MGVPTNTFADWREDVSCNAFSVLKYQAITQTEKQAKWSCLYCGGKVAHTREKCPSCGAPEK